jgi:hypothetical protein
MPFDNLKRELWAKAGYATNLGSAAADLPPSPEFIRLYHLTTATHALNNISFARLKVARYSDLNDPFELLSLSLMDPAVRKTVQTFKALQDSQSGLVCFSEDWTSPVMWSHYAEKHRGICLGFDVLRTAALEVHYNDKRLRTELEKDANPENLPIDLQEKLRQTKCDEWSYEKERRIVVPLTTAVQVGTLHFLPFSNSLQLAEVILGPSCTELLEDVRQVVRKHCPKARVFKARLAWKHFKVVPQESSVL